MMDAIFPTLLPNSGSRTRLRLAAAILAVSALLLAAGWLLWPTGTAQAQSATYLETTLTMDTLSLTYD